VRLGTRFCPNCGHTLALAEAAQSAAVTAAAGAATISAQRAEAGSRFAQHWAEIKFVGGVFGMLLATSFVYGLLVPGNGSPWPEVAAQAVGALVVLTAVALRRREVAFYFKLHPIGARAWAGLAAVAVVFLIAMTAYFTALERLGVPFASMTSLYVRA